jgi:hypothetical protein
VKTRSDDEFPATNPRVPAIVDREMKPARGRSRVLERRNLRGRQRLERTRPAVASPCPILEQHRDLGSGRGHDQLTAAPMSDAAARAIFVEQLLAAHAQSRLG